jgi:hypothetical protein
MGGNIAAAFIHIKSLSIRRLGGVEHNKTSPKKPRDARKAMEAVIYTHNQTSDS